MSINLPTQAAGGIAPEYAATSTTFNRQVQLVGGEMTPVFTCHINYERIDYVIQGGKKIGIMQAASPNFDQNRSGSIFLDAEKVQALSSSISPAQSKGLFEDLTGMVDSLIRIDLIARKIITE